MDVEVVRLLVRAHQGADLDHVPFEGAQQGREGIAGIEAEGQRRIDDGCELNAVSARSVRDW